MKIKIFYLFFGLTFLIIIYNLYNRYSDYKCFKSNEYIFTSRIIEKSNETFFNNYLRYPENEEELFDFIKINEELISEFPEDKIPANFLEFAIGNKFIKDSLYVLYSFSYNKKDDWPNLLYSLDTLTFFDFVFKQPDILIYGSFPPSDICDKRNSKLILNENDKIILNEDLERKINFQLRKTRINYFTLVSDISSSELKTVYLEFTKIEEENIELLVHCYNDFNDEFKKLLIGSLKDIMIENNLKKVIFPLHIINNN